MKYYMLEGTFVDGHPTAHDLQTVLAEHAAYLTNEVNRSNILVAGPKADRSGGIIIVRSDDIGDFCTHDPLVRQGAQRYRITEFSINEYLEVLGKWRNAA